MSAFLSDLNIQTIDSNQKEKLEQPIDLQEILDSINAMQNGKTPGPDGYTVEFYKAFAPKLAPILLKMFENSLNNGKLPQSLTEAFITLILKPGKDPLDCSSYRPISLLNVDVKILAKLLASRIDIIIPEIVSPDQTGFIRGRHSFTNLRRLFGLVYSPASREAPEVVVSLDAEKAFDRVEWCYLFSVKKKWFWPKICSLGPIAIF